MRKLPIKIGFRVSESELKTLRKLTSQGEYKISLGQLLRKLIAREAAARGLT